MSRIAASSGLFSPAEIELAVELVEERLHRGPESGYHFIFAESGTVVIGYACFGPIPLTRSGFDLYWIAVHNECRGLGYGKELVRRTEELIRERSGTRVYIETSSRPQYEATREFYLTCGYRKHAVLEDFYAHGDDKVIYLKVLE